ncbi:histidine phosphatase family protein [Micromonospora sp. M12]
MERRQPRPGAARRTLNDRGRDQARAAAPLLAALRPDAIVASDLSRAAETAAALAALTGLPVSTDARLRERHFGQWQGLHLTEVAERFPEEYSRWRAGDRTRARTWSLCTTSASGSASRCGKRPTRHPAALGDRHPRWRLPAGHGSSARLGHRRAALHRLVGQLPLE